MGERGKILIKSGLVNPICNQIMWNSGKIKIQSWFSHNLTSYDMPSNNKLKGDYYV